MNTYETASNHLRRSAFTDAIIALPVCCVPTAKH